MEIRFNHMEITFPKGALTPEFLDDVKTFYGDVFGFSCTSGVMFGEQCITMRLGHNDFLLLIEGDDAMTAPGFDHLGFELTSRDDVDATFGKVKEWRERDERIQLKEYADGVMDGRQYRAYYVKHLLPIWFDVQFSEPVPAR
jgi:hypothetical protein